MGTKKVVESMEDRITIGFVIIIYMKYVSIIWVLS